MTGKKKSHLVPITTQPMSTDERLKKSVGAIHSSGKLTLVERKLANVLMYSAYDTLLTKRTHTIPVPIMCAMLGWDASNRIDYLKEALSSLQQTTIQFNLREDGHEVWESMTMLSYAHIKNGVCTYRYDEALAERLFDPAMFAMISLQVQRRIDSAYALNLYENCIRYKDTNTGSTGRWTLEFFREVVGATASYCDDFRLLNRKVIKPAIEKINEVSDIVIEVEYEKQVRTVVALKFRVRDKTAEEKQAMQTALPGLSFTESVDVFAELRNTEAFKALKKHGVAERLAFVWIREKGEQAVLDMVAYTEERDAKNLINTNTRAYMQSLVKAGAEFGQSDYDKEKSEVIEAKAKVAQSEVQKNRLAELETEFRTIRIKEARNALTLEERNAHARAWLQTEAGQGRDANFDAGKGRFKDSVTNIQFEQVYLSKVVATPHTQTEFKAWLKETKNLDLVKLGLEG
jgi:plasmid replication initiation protein